MYVDRYMSTPAITIDREDSIAEARRLLEEHGIRHLPVTGDGGRLVGVVSDRDIRSSWPSPLDRGEVERLEGEVGRMPVREIMTVDPVSLTTAATLDDALLALEKKKVGALPVTDGKGIVAGVLSVQDLMKAYRELFGLGEEGSSLVVIEEDGRPDLLARVHRVLEECGVPFSRIIRTGGGSDGEGVVYLRVNTYNVHALHKALDAAGFRRPVDGRDGSERGE
jgi:acetoin utilization protein AcuB